MGKMGLCVAKKSKEDTVVDCLSRDHALVAQWTKPDGQTEGEAFEQRGSTSGGKQRRGIPVVREVLKPKADLNSLFTDCKRDPAGLFTEAEAREVLAEYIKRHDLTDADGAGIRLDTTLQVGVFKGTMKSKDKTKSLELPDVSTEELLFATMIQKKMVPYHVIEGMSNAPLVKRGVGTPR